MLLLLIMLKIMLIIKLLTNDKFVPSLHHHRKRGGRVLFNTFTTEQGYSGECTAIYTVLNFGIFFSTPHAHVSKVKLCIKLNIQKAVIGRMGLKFPRKPCFTTDLHLFESTC